MGYFSWLTADDKTSIACADSPRPVKTVHLLQPNDAKPITETSYAGYGEFGGIDAYVWLARHNLPPETVARLNHDELREVGVTMGCGRYFVDAETGTKWSVFHSGAQIVDPEIVHFPGTYAQVIPEIGMTPNDLIASGRFKPVQFEVTTPIKLSFDKDAVYEKLPASESCPHQGFFYDDDDGDADATLH